MPVYSEKNYGLGDPDCPHCHGLGYVRYDVPDDHPHFGKVFDCECRKAQANADRMAYLRRVGGLQHLSDKTFDTFDPEPGGLSDTHQRSLQSAYQLALNFAQNPEGWLFLMGGYGCGKTHLAAAIANYQIGQNNRVIFVTAPDLLDHLRSSFDHSSEEEGYSARFEEVRNIPLLVLDDLGIESPTAWATEKLYQLINYRYNARLPTVLTTNHALEDLEMRLRSRLSHFDIIQQIHINAPDYRRGAGRAQTSDLNDLNLYRHMTFDNFDLRTDLPSQIRDNLARMYQITREYAEDPSGWLVIFGEYGSGKTHLAAAIANTVSDRGHEALFITVPDLLDHLRAAFAPNSPTSYDKRFSEIKTAHLLILDDLGTESATPWAREKLYQLFNYRYNAKLATVITTAQPMEDLDPRLVTRIRDQRLCRRIAILAPAYLSVAK